jgi:hypothetical protein
MGEAKKRGRGRPKTGSVSEHDDPSAPGGFHYDVRITYPDGTRSNRRCLPAGTSHARAREIAKAMSERAVEQAAAAKPPEPPPPETFAAWAERWCAERGV